MIHVKRWIRIGAGENEKTAHDQRPDDSPQKHLVLVFIGNFEIAEDEQKHEKIVHAQREFDHVAGDELQSLRPAVPEQFEYGEPGCQCDPNRRPGKRLPKADAMGPAVEHTQVDHQHGQHEQVEEDPEEEHRR